MAWRCHGSRADLGIDAVCKAGYFLVALDQHAQELQTRKGSAAAEAGAPSIHVGVINGGEEVASYPAKCSITIERRTITAETAETVKAEIQSILEKLARTVSDFRYDLRAVFSRPPYFISRDHKLVQMVEKHATKVLGEQCTITGAPYWTDVALLEEAGVPGLIWGPKGYGLHSKNEWVEVESVRQLADAFISIEAEFCM